VARETQRGRRNHFFQNFLCSDIFFFLLKYVAIACYQLAQPNLIFLLPAGPKRKINFETPRKKT
jgi:hypothetical protein